MATHTRPVQPDAEIDRPSSFPRGRGSNRVLPEDRAIHEWYRFVLSFPPHLVRDYLEKFGVAEGCRVLDPFCGTGTTLVECKKLKIDSFGLEANPFAAFASETKLNWDFDGSELLQHARLVADAACDVLLAQGHADLEELPLFSKKEKASSLRRLPEDLERLLLKNSISPLPLHKLLVLLDSMNAHRDSRFESHERLALARAIVSDISNLHFGPEVGVGAQKKDAVVIGSWLNRIQTIAQDVICLPDHAKVDARVFCADARELSEILPPKSVDVVITSPPYPNEKDYTRTTRLESVLLGFLNSKHELRAVKRGLVRSNTRSVFSADTDHRFVEGNASIDRIAEAIETRRVELEKTSGFERLYAKLTRLYFGGMHRHLESLKIVLRPGACLAYVVGDQASYLRVMIRTGQLLAEIASSLGYEVLGLDLFRTRIATATGEQLREEVLLLRWPGSKGD